MFSYMKNIAECEILDRIIIFIQSWEHFPFSKSKKYKNCTPFYSKVIIKENRARVNDVSEVRLKRRFLEAKRLWNPLTEILYTYVCVLA